MKKIVLCVIVVYILGIASAAQAGLFPTTNQLFGTAMPSVGMALGREPSETVDDNLANREIYTGFSSDDYIAFGKYLAGLGANVAGYTTDDSTITITIDVNDERMEFAYDWTEGTATATYFAGTRPENSKQDVKDVNSILPPAGGVMPSMQYAIDRKPDEIKNTPEGTYQIYNDISDNEYTAFSEYLGRIGAKLSANTNENGILNAEVAVNGFAFKLTFDWNKKAATLFYPAGTTVEKQKWNPLGDGHGILPNVTDIGRELPNISNAINRLPDDSKTNGGIYIETYRNFSEDDYNVFSQYLLDTGCAVDEYHMDENSRLVIALSNGTGKFNFIYDAIDHVGETQYVEGNRMEAKMTATPAPTATLTPKPTATPKPADRYTQSECWTKAKNFFYSRSWKNPASVTINSYTTSYSDGEYTFFIDYSAMNGFGGYNRNTYMIVVSAITGNVTSSFSF